MKKVKDIVLWIALIEGGKSNVNVGDVREVVGIISDLVYEDSSTIKLLIANGERRAKRKKK